MASNISTLAPREPVAAPRPRLLPAVGIALGTVALLAFALSVNLIPRQYEVSEGDVAQYTIRSPRRVTYTSSIRTRSAREQAAAQIAPVAELSYERVQQQRRQLADLLRVIGERRAVANQNADQKREAVRVAVQPPLRDATARLIADMEASAWGSVAAESERLLLDVMNQRITSEELQDVLSLLPLRVSPGVPEANRPVVVELVSRFATSNVVVNQEATDRARRDAQDSVAPVVEVFERGQTVVRDGQIVGPLELEALEALNLRNPETDWRSIGGSFLLALATVGVASAYVWSFDRRMVYRYRRLLLLAALLVLCAVAAKMVIPGRPLWVYVFPIPAAAMLISSLLDARLAIVMGGLLAIIVAWVAGNSLEVGAMGLTGATVGALAVWRKERVTSFFLAGIYVAVAQIAVHLAFYLASRSDDLQLLTVILFELVVNGAISALLALGSVAIVGRLFGILTNLHLLELADPSQPLLRRLLMEAPGTYHHSIMVGNLGERAAEVIGADSLLVRVAAYYHDVGKLERPWAFVENQTEFGENIHESLDPVDSAQLISAHVTDGVALAEKYGLPARIREIIPQHHGTRKVSFFYQQATERSSEEIDPDLFTYPGPKPQTREAAILMLADSTEAAARAMRDHSRDAIEKLVETIVRQRVEDGQFDECNLTLRDLTLIKQSFVTLLSGIYHPRIPYPPARTNALPAPAKDRGA